MKTKKLSVVFNKQEYSITVNEQYAVNDAELERLIKDMAKLMGYHAKRICSTMQSYNEDYLEVWNMLAETAIYLLPKYRPEKSSWNTFYTNFAPRTVRKILKKINRYNLIETTYTDFNTPDNDILEDDDND